MSTLRDRVPLKRRKVIKKSFISTFRAIAIAGLLSAFFFAVLWAIASGSEGQDLESVLQRFRLPILGWLVLILGWICAEPIYQYLYYLTYYYDSDEKNVTIRKGVLAKREIILPYSKITDVYIDQDLADVFFGLWDVHISTPTAESGKFAHIDGVNKKGALELRKMILDKINTDAPSTTPTA